MEKIKFSSPDPSQRDFTLALRRNVNAYFKEKGISPKGNATMIVKSIVMLSLYLVPFVMILTVQMSAWIALLLVILMGLGTAGIGMSVMHDAVHGAYSTHPWVNRLMGSTLYLLGSNVFNWKIQHNVLHHSFTNIDGQDEDIGDKGPIRLSEHKPLKKIHYYQHIHAFFFYGLMTISKLVKEFGQMRKYLKMNLASDEKVNSTQEYVKMISYKIIYLLAIIGLPLWLTTFSWWQVLLGFFIMHLISGLVLSTVFQLAHVVEGAEQPMPDAAGLVENDWVVHELLTTANFARENRFLNWCLGGLNFQIEHHLFPHICHVHYRNLSPIVERTALEYGLMYNLKPTFSNALVSHVRRLKALGREKAS
jgi:linoleoyl-CoA desaturase